MMMKQSRVLRKPTPHEILRSSSATPARTGGYLCTIQGRVDVDLGPIKLADIVGKEGLDAERHVGCWLGSKEFASCKVGEDGSFVMSLAVRDGDPDVVKVQTYLRTLDPETSMTKPFPLCFGLLCARKLLSEHSHPPVALSTPFSDVLRGTLYVTACSTKAPCAALTPSALRGVGGFNASLTKASEDFVRALGEQSIHVPTPANGFEVGLTNLSVGASEELGIPFALAHYAALSKMVKGSQRYVHHALLAHYLYLYCMHTRQTPSQLLSLPDKDFAREGAQILWMATGDAGEVPYQRDALPQPALTVDVKQMKVGFTAKLETSEDIGNPFGAPCFIGERFLEVAPAKDPPLPSALDTRERFQALMRMIHGQKFEELSRTLFKDDCETSGSAGALAAETVRKVDMSSRTFAMEVAGGGFKKFVGWNAQSFQQCSDVYTRLQGLLRSKALQIELCVGCAGGASAGNVKQGSGEGSGTSMMPGKVGSGIDAESDLGGHCFGIMRYAAGGEMCVELLEGTTYMRKVQMGDQTPKFTVRMLHVRGEGALAEETKVLLTGDKFLSELSKAVGEETHVPNKLLGDPIPTGGVSGDMEIPGFARATLHLPNLQSLHGSPEVPFYRWVVTTGLRSGVKGQVGTMPVDEKEFSADGVMGAGCRPSRLADPSLKALSFELPKEHVRASKAIMREAWPPNAPPSTLAALMNHWEAAEQLEGAAFSRDISEAGLGEHQTTVFMQSPAAPALVGPIHELCSIVLRTANEINLAKKGSDGIRAYAKRAGTGVHTVICVPWRAGTNTTLTYMKSLREAKEKLGWPSAAEPPKKTASATGARLLWGT